MKLSVEEQKYMKIGAGILGVLLIYKFFIANKTDNTGVTTDPTGNGNNAGNGGLTPYVFNEKSVADTLWNAMKNMGTDEDAIFEALKPVNQQQFAEVFKAFGKRGYNTVTGNNLSVYPFELDTYDLKKWLKYELSDQNYNTLRIKYPSIL